MTDEPNDDLVVPVPSWNTNPPLLGAIMGVVAGFNCLAEQMVAKGLIEPASLAGQLEALMQRWLATGDPILAEGIRVLDMMRAPLVSEEHAAARRLATGPARGSA